MAAKSSIKKLDPRIREAVDAAIREDRATIDELVALIESHGAKVSRSAVGRYAKNAAESLKKFREAQEIAKVWVGKLNEDPQGDVGRLCGEMLRLVAFQQLDNINAAGGEASPMEVMLLAKALEHVAKSQKTDVDRVVKIQEKIGTRLKKLEEKAGRPGGKITLEDLQAIRQDVYGIAR